jgi:hypothetical protein
LLACILPRGSLDCLLGTYLDAGTIAITEVIDDERQPIRLATDGGTREFLITDATLLTGVFVNVYGLYACH